MPNFQDNDLWIVSNASQTKIARFNASSIGAGSTRVFTLPNASATLAGTDIVNTWTSSQVFNEEILFYGNAAILGTFAFDAGVIPRFSTGFGDQTLIEIADAPNGTLNYLLAPAFPVARSQTLSDASGALMVAGNGADPPASGAMGKVTRTAQTAAVSATNLTNTTVAGLYEVNYYLSCTTAMVTDGTLTFQISYTDRVGATTQITATTLTLAATSTGTTALKGSFIAYLASGNITYQTNLTGAQTTSRYSLEARCTFLG